MARMRVQLLGHQLENLSASLDQRHAITLYIMAIILNVGIVLNQSLKVANSN